MAATTDNVLETILSDKIQTHLIDRQPLTLVDLAILAQPGFVESLEKKWRLSITGSPSLLFENYPTQHWTVNWEQYHYEDTAFELACADGLIEVVKAMVTKNPSKYRFLIQDQMIRTSIAIGDAITDGGGFMFRFSSNPKIEVIAAARYGHVDVLEYLYELMVERGKNGKPVSKMTQFDYYRAYVAGFNGDIELYGQIRKSSNAGRFALRGAVEGNQASFIASKKLPKSEEDLLLAIKLGHVDVVKAMCRRHRYTKSLKNPDIMQRAIESGSLPMVLYIQNVTHMTISTRYYGLAIASGSDELIAYFRHEFGDQLEKQRADYVVSGRHDFILKALELGYDNWQKIFVQGYKNYDMELIRISIEKGGITKEQALNIIKNSTSLRFIDARYKIDEYLNSLPK